MEAAATQNSLEKADERSNKDGHTIILGIESTAHTFGVGIISESHPHILADARRVYKPRTGGILPREVAAYFSKVAGDTIEEALDQANLSIKEVSGIAVALGPGMGPALRIGATVARALSSAYAKPLIPVNHALAHIEIARFLTKLRDPLIVYVSGGNTTISSFVDGKYRVFGETLDIALGNLLDTFAREVGIAPPYIVNGRHSVEVCAQEGEFIEGLPYIVKGQDVSFSGLLTAAIKLYKKGGVRLADICYTLREIAFSSIAEVAERGVSHTGKREVILTGGVAASKVLREKIEAMSRLHGIKFSSTPPKYSVDNGVMIALTGLYLYRHGITVEPRNALVRQRWRLDEVEVPWYPGIL